MTQTAVAQNWPKDNTTLNLSTHRWLADFNPIATISLDGNDVSSFIASKKVKTTVWARTIHHITVVAYRFHLLETIFRSIKPISMVCHTLTQHIYIYIVCVCVCVYVCMYIYVM